MYYHNEKMLLVCVYRRLGNLIKKFLKMNLTECTSGLKKMSFMDIKDPKELRLFQISMVSLHGKLLAQSHMLI